MTTAAPFTAVVVTWNSAEEVAGLVHSVEARLGDRCRLLFVDNHSEDGTLAAIAAAAPAAEVIALEHNAGFGPANNVGVRAAETEVVALVNPDTLMVDDSLAALAGLAEGERALYAPRLLNEDGTPQIGARPPLAGWEAAAVVLPGALMPRRLRERCEPWRFARRLPAGWLSGACLVARRDLLLELGPFDERLLLYGEDADLSVRGWQAGIPSVLAGDVARIVHLGGRSGTQAFSDVGMQRKIEARWWVVHERLGTARGVYDMAMQFLVHATRWAGGRLTGRDATPHAVWLRAGVRAVRAGRPALPPPLPGAPGVGR